MRWRKVIRLVSNRERKTVRALGKKLGLPVSQRFGHPLILLQRFGHPTAPSRDVQIPGVLVIPCKKHFGFRGEIETVCVYVCWEGNPNEEAALKTVVEFSLLCCTSMAHAEILRYGRK